MKRATVHGYPVRRQQAKQPRKLAADPRRFGLRPAREKRP